MFKEFDITKADFNPFEKIGSEWFLTTAGDENSFNAMTCSWGFMGVMWSKNVALAVIRPQRYTKKFLDEQEYFTISFYPESCKKALGYLGSHSGYDVPDKIAQCGLTPTVIDGVPCFEEADTVLVCRKLYCSQMPESGFIDKSVAAENYPSGDFHYQYAGEIVKAYKKA